MNFCMKAMCVHSDSLCSVVCGMFIIQCVCVCVCVCVCAGVSVRAGHVILFRRVPQFAKSDC